MQAEHEADRQLPVGQEIFLDHVGHFVRDPQLASAALARAGFAPTAISVQVNPDSARQRAGAGTGPLAGGAPQPTGTGNVTAMFARGYVEALFKTADTPLGREFDAALAEYSGLHLAAFSVADAGAAHGRLAAGGFRMRPVVHFQRPVTTATGTGTAAFTVTRVERGEMAEGRVQILTHHTPDSVWQARWLDHQNGALGLLDLVVVVADLDDAAGRFARFTGRAAVPTPAGRAFRLDRGQVNLVTPAAWSATMPDVAIARLPFMAAYAVQVRALDRVAALLEQAGLQPRRSEGAVAAAFPVDLGVGAWFFVEQPDALPWRRQALSH
jgi:Glyoxalase-like domain